MNLRILNKWGQSLICLSALIFSQLTHAYTAQDGALLLAQTPVVDGSMPPDIAAIQKRGVLRQALNQTPAPPFSMRDSQGNWSGLEIDFGQSVAQQLGVKLQIVPAQSYDDLVTLLLQNKADMAMGLSILPKRQISVSFSNPYYSYHPHMLMNRLQVTQHKWTTPEKLTEGLSTTHETIKICVFADNAVGQILKQKFPNADVIAYTDRTQCFRDVAAGKVFASMGATPVEIRAFLQSNPQAALRTVDIELVNMEDLLGVAVPWQSFHLRDWLNIYINYLQQNGIQEQLSKKYGYPIT